MVDVSIDQHGDAVSRRFVSELPEEERTSLLAMYETKRPLREDVVVVCHSEPGAWHPAKYATSRCPPSGIYGLKVGRSMFETDRLPSGWNERLNGMDEVWVPTEFHRDIFARGGVSREKLWVVGEAVDTEFFDPERIEPERPLHVALEEGRVARKGEEKEFSFLSVFKWEYRKGWDVLLQAYISKFTRRDPVCLYILTSSYHSTSDFHGEIQRYLREQLSCESWEGLEERVGDGDGIRSSRTNDSLPRAVDFCVEFRDTVEKSGMVRRSIHVSDLPKFRLLSRVPQHRLPTVYRSVDAFVLPSRGEGWGRPHVEAMSMGLPIAATNWSGPTEYLFSSNGYPIQYTHFRPIPHGPFAGHLMAEPSVAHLAQTMYDMYSNPTEAKRRGRQARQDMLRRFQPSFLARSIHQHLSSLLPPPQNTTTTTTTPSPNPQNYRKHGSPKHLESIIHPRRPQPPPQEQPVHTKQPVKVIHTRARHAPLSAGGQQIDATSDDNHQKDEL